MKKILTITLIVLGAVQLNAQKKITLENCYELARENYPLIKQKKYIEQSADYNVRNVWKGYLPQLNISGQATYQSDVTSMPLTIPGLNIETLTKDQYKISADINQTIYDGGMISAQSDIYKSISEIDDRKTEVELTKLKERVTQIYFGILLLDEQMIQTELIKKDLQSTLEKLNAAYKNGTATKSNVEVLNAEKLKVEQREIEIKLSRKSFTDMLGLLINQQLGDNQTLAQPEQNDFRLYEEINRPEIFLYESQSDLIESQNKLATAKVLPKANLFFQGGYGKPALNMLKNEFDWFYIAGAKVSLPISNLYTYDNEKEINELNKKTIETQKETFLLNTKLSLSQQKNEITKLEKLINVDKEIIGIRTSVKEAAKAQLENGVITSSDYVRELNAEDQAKQNLAIHNVQLMLAKQNYKLISGN